MSFFGYLCTKFPSPCKDVISIRLRPILLNSSVTYFVLCPKVTRYLLSFCDIDIKQTAQKSVWEECETALDKFTDTDTSHMKWISGISLCTLYSSANIAFFSL
jgi:hypothetical protein